jgi:hypothetical protein
MKMRSLAWVALCAAPFLAAQPDTGLAADPLRLTADQMDTVSAGGATLTSVIASGSFRLKISSDRNKKRIIIETLDRRGHVRTTRTINVAKGNWSKRFSVDGYKVNIGRRGSMLSVDVNGNRGQTRIVSRYDLRGSHVVSSNITNSSVSGTSQSNTTVISQGSSSQVSIGNHADAKRIISNVLGSLRF